MLGSYDMKTKSKLMERSKYNSLDTSKKLNEWSWTEMKDKEHKIKKIENEQNLRFSFLSRINDSLKHACFSWMFPKKLSKDIWDERAGQI